MASVRVGNRARVRLCLSFDRNRILRGDNEVVVVYPLKHAIRCDVAKQTAREVIFSVGAGPKVSGA